MIAMEFTVDVDIGLFLLRQDALTQLVTDREWKTRPRGRPRRSYGHRRYRTEIPRQTPAEIAAAEDP
jgi:hypothetical protein